MPKNVQATIWTVLLISHASKVMLKIHQARLQRPWTKNFQMYKLDLEKGRGTREKAEKKEMQLPISVES